MSMRLKLMLIILGAIIFNMLILFGYYNIFIADSFFGGFNTLQEKLDNETLKIAQSISLNSRYQDILNKDSKSENLIFRLEDLNGKAIYESKLQKINFFYINSVKPVNLSGKIYLLKVTKPLVENEILKLPSIKNIFYAELMIIFVILAFLSIVLYFRFVRPIEILQKAIAGYQGSYNIKRTRRFDEIGKLQNSFVQLKENLDEEKEKQNRIIASISHDIKTPLTSVMGYAERFKKGNLSSERASKYVDTIYSKSMAIKDLIEEFDDYLSYNQQSALKKQEITVRELMKIILIDYEDELTNIDVKFKIENSCPDVTLKVDISKLRRVFGNIIGNSLKHFTDENKKIGISCKQGKNTVIFSIDDNGIGVAEELLSKIFEPMYTSDEGRLVAGLGLAICMEIINTHGGEIWAENNPEGGLIISFELPI